MTLNKLERKYVPFAYMFLIPTVAVFLLFYLVPIVTVFFTSFTRWDGFNAPTFNGITNYLRFFTQSSFLISLRNLLLWSLIAATLHVGFGVLVAFILYQRPKGWKAIRAVYMIPNIISSAAMAMIFRFMFNNDFGVLNGVIRLVNPSFQVNWFFESPWAFIAITLTWLFYGAIITLIVLGDLMNIPSYLHDAAKIDGATGLQAIVHIELPLCRYAIGTSIILSITSRIAMYEAIALTTRGGPGDDTMNIPIILMKAITDLNYGLANAAAVFMFVMGIVTLLVINRLFKMNDPVY
ncbi:MAG: sugar ABC transporter permease [Spirochaetia bacterium]|nr:sugar ABC transporter permease [Spirochaetia bacterium]